MWFIKKTLTGIIVNAATLFLLIILVNEISYTGGAKFFIIGGLVLGLVNMFIKPVLKILSLPFVILSGGLFLILINAFILWFLTYFLDILQFRNISFVIPDLQSYLFGAILFGVINWIIHLIFKSVIK